MNTWLTDEDLEIWRARPVWLQAPSIAADRRDADLFLSVQLGWRVLGYRSVCERIRCDVERAA